MTAWTKRLAPAFAVALLLVASGARATVITPGNSIAGPGANLLLPPVATVAGVIAGTYTIGSTGSGAYSATVYSPESATGKTSILFSVTVAQGDVNRITLTDFTGFTTDIFQVGAPITTGARSIDRSSGGDTLGFTFNGTNLPGLKPFQTTSYLIRTDAPSYKSGFINLIDGGVTAKVSFAPAAVPLPATVWMGLTLLGGAGGVGRLKKFFRRDLTV